MLAHQILNRFAMKTKAPYLPESRSSEQAIAEGQSTNRLWHHWDAGRVLQTLEAGREGLDEVQVRERLQRHGMNRLPEKRERSAFMRFIAQFHNMLIYILLVAAGVTALLAHWIDTGVILAVLLINALIGFVQEGKAEQAMKNIANMLSLHARVLRDGRRRTVPAEELVPGDVVYLESGDRVPADLRLLEVKNLGIEESVLTGESVPVEKRTEPVGRDALLGDRRCMAFSSTLVASGRGTGVVTETGSRTQIGRISEMLSEVERVTTPLLRSMEQFGKVLAVAIIGFAAVMFLFGYLFWDYAIAELFLAIISLTVAAIPEGLPAIITITLAVGVQTMGGQNAIIRRLPAVETLGAVNVICTDKTGTLTRNEMTVHTLITADRRYQVEGSGYAPEGRILFEGEAMELEKHPDLRRVIEVGVLCNEAEVYRDENDQWSLDGDPTEGALVTLGLKAGLERSAYPRRLDYIPFESEHRFMATLNRMEQEEDNRMLIKGAPEVLLEHCDYEWSAMNGTIPFNREHWEEVMQRAAENGERLLAVACKPMGDARSIDMQDVGGLTLLGVTGMMDPPRSEAHRSVKACHRAGIRVVMITGDHAVTAGAIARQLDIAGEHGVVTGRQIEEADDRELQQLATRCNVFARTSPKDKLRLVQVLQAGGQVVAMTGDGVNDAPALRRADIGVAMGIKGTEVSRGASEMVLADDNFATIARAVEQGRTVYDNIRKAILFVLPTNGAEALVVVAALLAGIVLPITPVQILWINTVTAVTLALALAFEPAESRVMLRPPRSRSDRMLDGYFLFRIAYVALLIGSAALGFYYSLRQGGMQVELARTIAVNILVSGQLFYLFNCRHVTDTAISLRNITGIRVALLASGALVLLQLLFTYNPWLNHLFGTTGLQAQHWLYVIGSGLGVFLIVEAEKWITRGWLSPDETGAQAVTGSDTAASGGAAAGN